MPIGLHPTSPIAELSHPFYNPITMPIIELSDLSKVYRVYQKKEGLWASLRGLMSRQYREVQAVGGLDLTVEQGEFVAFLGPHGAGTTTTMKMH